MSFENADLTEPSLKSVTVSIFIDFIVISVTIPSIRLVDKFFNKTNSVINTFLFNIVETDNWLRYYNINHAQKHV